jgi:hypothetical protein
MHSHALARSGTAPIIAADHRGENFIAARWANSHARGEK